MALSLYNTLTRQVEPFTPLHPPRVTLYTCGPTVWNYAHIGNFRTFLFEDLLRRHLEASGYDVFHIMNLTDVDDRTITAAAAAGRRLGEYTAPFVSAFFEDRDYLRIRPAHVYPRATESIAAMVALVERLLERGVAYRGDDRVRLLRDRTVSDVRTVVSARPPGVEDRGPRGERRVRERRPPRLRAVEARDGRGRSGGRRVARPVRSRAARLAPGVFGDVAGGNHGALRGFDARPPCGRGGPDLSAPRRRDRAIGSCDRRTLRPLLAARRVSECPRNEDVEALRQLPHSPRSPGAGRGRGGVAVAVLADPLPAGARLHRRSPRRGTRRRAAPG